MREIAGDIADSMPWVGFYIVRYVTPDLPSDLTRGKVSGHAERIFAKASREKFGSVPSQAAYIVQSVRGLEFKITHDLLKLALLSDGRAVKKLVNAANNLHQGNPRAPKVEDRDLRGVIRAGFNLASYMDPVLSDQELEEIHGSGYEKYGPKGYREQLKVVFDKVESRRREQGLSISGGMRYRYLISGASVVI